MKYVKKPRSSLFYKYLISYLIILFIPLTLMQLLIHNSFYNILKRDAIQSNHNDLIQVQKVIDSKLNELNNICVQIYTNPLLSPYELTRNLYRTSTGMQELKNIIMANNSIFDIGLYIHGNNYIITPFTTCDIESFVNQRYKFKNWSYNEFYYTINKINHPSVRPAETIKTDNKNSSYITYIIPLPNNSKYIYGSVIFLIKENSLTGFFNNAISMYDGNAAIFDQNGNVISCLKENENINSQVFSNLYNKHKTNKFSNIKIGNNDYILSTINSKSSNWTYMTLVPEKKIMSKILDLKIRSFLTMLIIILIGAGIIYAITIINYNPIYYLKEFCEKISGKSNNKLNEFDAIRLTVTEIVDSNQQLCSKVSKSHTAVKDYLISNLLKGYYNNINDFNQEGIENNLKFSGNYYVVVMFYISNYSDTENKLNELIYALENILLEKKIEGFGKSFIETNKIVFILSNNSENKKFLNQTLEIMQKHIYTNTSCLVTVGVGNTYSSCSLISRSYIESSTAINYRLILGKNKIIYFNEVNINTTTPIIYPTQEIDKLIISIKTGQENNIIKSINELTYFLRKSNAPLHFIKCLCYDIINSIIKTMYQSGFSITDLENTYTDIAYLIEFDTIDDLETVLKNICYELSKQKTITIPKDHKHLLDNIYIYINKNYTNINFSVQNMAIDIGITPQYLSKIFKLKTGHTVSDYINNLKMEKAKKLLLTTDDSLKNIVNHIGYCDVSSFIRKFKQIFGITPTKYRNINK